MVGLVFGGGGRLRGGEGLVTDLGRWFCKEMSLRDLSCVIIWVFVSGLGGLDGGWIAQAKGGGGRRWGMWGERFVRLNRVVR